MDKFPSLSNLMKKRYTKNIGEAKKHALQSNLAGYVIEWFKNGRYPKDGLQRNVLCGKIWICIEVDVKVKMFRMQRTK